MKIDVTDSDRQQILESIANYISENTDSNQLTEDEVKLLAKGIVAMLFGDEE